MVAPHDIGQLAARLLRAPASSTGLQYIEGPAHYSSADVAAAFSEVLHRPVVAEETPRDQWPQVLQQLGFSAEAAESFANMTAATLEKQDMNPDTPERGATTLRHYVQQLARQQ